MDQVPPNSSLVSNMSGMASPYMSTSVTILPDVRRLLILASPLTSPCPPPIGLVKFENSSACPASRHDCDSDAVQVQMLNAFVLIVIIIIIVIIVEFGAHDLTQFC